MSLMGNLQRRTERRSVLINAGTLDQPSESFITSVGGGAPTTGVHVSERNATGIPVVYACDRVIKQDVAKTTVTIKRVSADGRRIADPDHPAARTFSEMANPFMTAYDFKETQQGYLNLWGNCYAQIQIAQIITNVNVKRRQEVRLWPLDAGRMTIAIDDANRLRYTYAMPNGAKPQVWIYDPTAPQIFHLRQNTLDGINGRGPVRVLRESMAIIMAADRYTGRLYGQGGHPRAVLSTSQKLTAPAVKRIRDDYETLTVGEHNWHRPLILDHDLKLQPGMSQKDAEFVQTRNLSRDELCGAFRVPPHKIGNLDRSTNNNIEHQSIEHVGDCLDPHFVNWELGIARDILTPLSPGTHVAQFNRKELVRGDFKSLNDGLHLMRQDGVITGNQWLREIGSDEVISAADGGDTYLVNSTMVPIAMAGQTRPALPAAPAAAA